MKQYPVGKTQKIVLDALRLSAQNFQEAEAIFDRLGIVVSHRRQGRQVVPVVTVKPRWGGSLDEDGEEFRQYPDIDLSGIQEWVKDDD